MRRRTPAVKLPADNHDDQSRIIDGDTVRGEGPHVTNLARKAQGLPPRDADTERLLTIGSGDCRPRADR